MVTSNGGGYSQWRNLELTRWRSDQTCDGMGTFCYLYEPKSDHLWSASYNPVGIAAEDYSVEFTLDRAVFRRVSEGLHSEMEVIVSQEDDVEIRRITLINRSSFDRTLDLTSYAELSLAPHNADRQHPAFNKLFIQTEALREQRILLAYRRARSSGRSSCGCRPSSPAQSTTEMISSLQQTGSSRLIGNALSAAGTPWQIQWEPDKTLAAVKGLFLTLY